MGKLIDAKWRFLAAQDLAREERDTRRYISKLNHALNRARTSDFAEYIAELTEMFIKGGQNDNRTKPYTTSKKEGKTKKA